MFHFIWKYQRIPNSYFELLLMKIHWNDRQPFEWWEFVFFQLFFKYNNFWNLSKQRDRMNSKEINDMNVNSFESRNVSFVRMHESQRTSQIINHFLLSVLRNLLCLLIFFSGFCHSILLPICKLNRHSKLCYAIFIAYFWKMIAELVQWVRYFAVKNMQIHISTKKENNMFACLNPSHF